MWFGLISLFPELFQALSYGITGRALQTGKISYQVWNPRQFTLDKHQTVDAKPYGGGAGMVMQADPLHQAILAAKASAPSGSKVIYLSPQGQVFQQSMAEAALETPGHIFIAGRYEGIDERIIETHVDAEWSLGDFVLTGGEFAALAMIDTITRLLPGVVGDELSVLEDSFTCGLLKYPQYTRPEQFLDKSVPEILLSGHHEQIRRWRLQASLGRTWLKKPELIASRQLNNEEKDLLQAFIDDYKRNNPRKT